MFFLSYYVHFGTSDSEALGSGHGNDGQRSSLKLLSGSHRGVVTTQLGVVVNLVGGGGWGLQLQLTSTPGLDSPPYHRGILQLAMSEGCGS